MTVVARYGQSESSVDYRMLSRILEGAMRARGLNEQQAAEEIGVSGSTVGKLLGLSVGRPGDLMLGTYIAICQWLNVSLDTFIIGDRPVVPTQGVIELNGDS